MHEAAVSPLTAWSSFYAIIGTAAAALTGLMFVTITMVARTRIRNSSNESIATFGTPTVVHFGAALLIAVSLNAPWQVLWNIAILLGLTGLGGVAYVATVLRRALHQTIYLPVLEDWLWHVTFPFISYLALIVAAFLLPSYPIPIMFVIGAATALLIFIGIPNAWDNVSYIAIEYAQRANKKQD